MALTRRQREVLDVVRGFIDVHGYSPSLEEIGRALGLSSVATVHKHVSLLAEKGFVQRAWNQNRSIDLLEPEPSGTVRLPLQGAIAAGRPIEAVTGNESVLLPAGLVRDRARTFVLRVRGDSMIDEQIRDGDLVIVESRDTALDGQTVVALIDGTEATLKRLRREAERVVLEPANPALRPLPYDPQRVRIQGVVVGLLRRY